MTRPARPATIANGLHVRKARQQHLQKRLHIKKIVKSTHSLAKHGLKSHGEARQ